MNKNKIIKVFDALGALMRCLGNKEPWSGYSLGLTEEEFQSFEQLIVQQINHNAWFTPENVRSALLALGKQIHEENLNDWLSTYLFTNKPKKVALIMAGNIPLVGFHDFLCVLLSGHHVVAKVSSDDRQLLPAFVAYIVKLAPQLQQHIQITQGKIGQVDAVIATGSDNSSLYFEYYFGKYPHIFRKNRTSVAVLNGTESTEELFQLGKDVFSYFGLGCRNVSHLLVPNDFDLNRFFEAILPFGEIIHHHKYANNYEYNKVVYLLNKELLLDNDFVLLRETADLFSPLGVLNYHRYHSLDEVEFYLLQHSSSIQTIVGKRYSPFGSAQNPTLTDYADGIDTMKFLNAL